MEEITLPKKLFRVADLTFVLPDDFEGGLEEAFQLVTNRVHEALHESERTDKSDEEMIGTILDDNTKNLALKYGIFEIGEDGKYHLK